MAMFNLNVFEIKGLEPVFKEYPHLTKEWYECPAERADVAFTLSQLIRVPDPIKKLILDNALKLKVRRERNSYIRLTISKIVNLLPAKLQFSLMVEDSEIRQLAEDCSDRCRRIASRANVNRMQDSLTAKNTDKKHSLEPENPVNEIHMPLTGIAAGDNSGSKSGKSVNDIHRPYTEICPSTQSKLFELLTEYIISFGIAPIKVGKKGITERGAIKRMCEKKWWNGKLRKIFYQAYEQVMIELNQIHKFKQIYASDLTVLKRKQQLIQNEQLMGSLYLVNDDNQRFSLKELSDLNVSNPKIRKAELMVRMRGFEEVSKELNHQGIFITITCPSKYHAAYAKSGQRNDKYQGFTPYQANQYLCSQWARIRAEWDRRGIKPYGFRVAEPQHDATPHWHILLFVEPHEIDPVQEVIRHYALEEDGDEKGAAKYRCDFKLIDPKKGSATGYLAKYVSKNIDGKGLDVGVYGEDPITAAQRVDAWSSCWCIRQFQQIGGPPVSVYRELRRLRKSLGIDSIIEKARMAADNSDWKGFVNVMGGVFIKRKEHPLKLAYDTTINHETGECKQGYYDGNLIQAIKGLFYQGKMIMTRFFNWRLERTNVVRSNLEYCK